MLAHAAGIPVEEALLAGVTVIAGYVRAIAARWRGAREHRRIQAKAGWVFDAVWHLRPRLLSHRGRMLSMK